MRTYPSLRERLLEKAIDCESGCIEFIGSRNAQGYGKIYYQGHHIGTHRASWIVHNGPIPNDLCVLHKCDNPSCINVEHLFLGTHEDNAQDRSSKTRFSDRSGANHHMAKLIESEVREIKTLINQGELTTQQIADRFNMTHSGISDIKFGRSWAHVK